MAYMEQQWWNKLAPRQLLHVGAHECQERPVYNKAGVKRVLWVEANPEVVKRMQPRARKWPRHTIVQGLVTDKPGQSIDFNLASFDQSSSVLQLKVHRKYYPKIKFVGKVKLTTTTIDRLLKQHDLTPDMLVMDIQGAELLALKGAPKLLKSDTLRHVYLEVNYEELYKGCALLKDIVAFLQPHGFELLLELNKHNGFGDALFSRNPNALS